MRASTLLKLIVSGVIALFLSGCAITEQIGQRNREVPVEGYGFTVMPPREGHWKPYRNEEERSLVLVRRQENGIDTSQWPRDVIPRGRKYVYENTNLGVTIIETESAEAVFEQLKKMMPQRLNKERIIVSHESSGVVVIDGKRYLGLTYSGSIHRPKSETERHFTIDRTILVAHYTFTKPTGKVAVFTLSQLRLIALPHLADRIEVVRRYDLLEDFVRGFNEKM